MNYKLTVTEARNRFLHLPDMLKPGEAVEIYRHRKPVLTVMRTAKEADCNPFSIMAGALKTLPGPKEKVPENLASRYKYYLYGQKTKNR